MEQSQNSFAICSLFDDLLPLEAILFFDNLRHFPTSSACGHGDDGGKSLRVLVAILSDSCDMMTISDNAGD